MHSHIHTNKNLLTVKVDANFLAGNDLFDWIKKYAQSYEGGYAYWDEFAFMTDDLDETDAILVFNTPSKPVSMISDPARVVAFMMEPGIPSRHPWMYRKLEQYAAVYSPVGKSANTVSSHGFTGWYSPHNWPSLCTMEIPQKTNCVSCISSGLAQLKGHRLRNQFIEQLQKKIPGIDFFGRHTRPLQDKMDGLLPYKYSIAIENSSAPWYFTEKISDCFLAYTVPVYYGCTNISRYFPEKSVIEMDIRKPERAIRIVEDALAADDWNERLPALQEARELVLNRYQPLAGAASILRDMRQGKKQLVQLDPVNISLFDTCKRLFRAMNF